MATKLLLSLTALLFATAPVLANSPWEQCGGLGWIGDVTCPSGYVCTASNQWYSQCIPGTAGPITTKTTTSPGGGTTAPSGGTTTTSGSPTSNTLIPGYAFIRAVEAPNFHKYLMSEKLGTASDAVLGAPANAAQFKIVNGQLVQYVTATSQLYAVVEGRADSTVNKLKVSWSTAPASGSNAGTFLWAGDTLEWQIATISRPQLNAWLICADSSGNLDLYVNLGPYSYNTPAGCADETIHAYTGPYPTD